MKLLREPLVRFMFIGAAAGAEIEAIAGGNGWTGAAVGAVAGGIIGNIEGKKSDYRR